MNVTSQQGVQFTIRRRPGVTFIQRRQDNCFICLLNIKPNVVGHNGLFSSLNLDDQRLALDDGLNYCLSSQNPVLFLVLEILFDYISTQQKSLRTKPTSSASSSWLC